MNFLQSVRVSVSAVVLEIRKNPQTLVGVGGEVFTQDYSLVPTDPRGRLESCPPRQCWPTIPETRLIMDGDFLAVTRFIYVWCYFPSQDDLETSCCQSYGGLIHAGEEKNPPIRWFMLTWREDWHTETIHCATTYFHIPGQWRTRNVRAILWLGRMAAAGVS